MVIMSISIEKRLSYCLAEDVSVAKAALYGLLRIAFEGERLKLSSVAEEWRKRVGGGRECSDDNLKYFAEQFEAVLRLRKSELSMAGVCEAIIAGWQSARAEAGQGAAMLPYEEQHLKALYVRLALMLYIDLADGDDKQRLGKWLMNVSERSLNGAVLNDLLSFSPEAPELLLWAERLLKRRVYNPNFDEVTAAALKRRGQNAAKWGIGYLACLRREAKLARRFRPDIWFAYLRIAKACGASEDKSVRDLSVTAYWKARRYWGDKKPNMVGYSLERFIDKTAELYDVSLAADAVLVWLADYSFDAQLMMVDRVLRYVATPVYQVDSILALLQRLAESANAAADIDEVAKRYESLLAKAFDNAEGGELVRQVQDMCMPEQEKILLAVMRFELEQVPKRVKPRLVEFAALALEVIKKHRSEVAVRKAKEILALILKADWSKVTTSVPVEVWCKAMAAKAHIRGWNNWVELLMVHLAVENVYESEDVYAACEGDKRQVVDLRACWRKSLIEAAKLRKGAEDAYSKRQRLILQLRDVD